MTTHSKANITLMLGQ